MITRLSLLRRMTQRSQTANEADPAPILTLKRGVIYKGLLALAALVLALVMLFTMTAAWYKNVVQTSGLIFHVDQWGLDSSVNIQDELIGAAPGDSGSIRLSVDNTSEGVISVTLGAGKGDLYNDVADMRKRLYFYIDDMAYRGGEHTPRVYLNSVETYSYTVLPAQQLVLGDNGNASPLMWEWVFDVVGYYFYGTVTTDTTASVAEYLRPVEYELDRATFRDGLLTTVDGTTAPKTFIETLSEEDGFEGTVTTTLTAADGRVYYPVSVDDEGEGVWIYLCNLGEIEYETMVDTKLGSSIDTDRQFETYLHVTAQQKQLAVMQVATEDQLKAALLDNTTDMVQLTGSVALSSVLQMKPTREKILDLDGHTLSTSANTLMKIEEDVSFTVLDGTLQGNGSASAYGLEIVGGDVAMSHVTITDTAQGVRVMDNTAKYNDSRVTMTDCTVYSTVAGIQIRGNGAATAGDTHLSMDRCVIESSGYYALTGSGNNDAYGTNVLIRNCTMRVTSSSGTAIYHPQRDSVLLVEDSVLEGFTTVAIKGGTVTLMDTQVTASTRAGMTPQPPAFDGSGYADTGAAVYVETGYNQPCTVTIGGDSRVTSANAAALMLYESTNPLYTITITGGRYSSDVSAFLPDGYRCVKDGDYWLVQAID